jgi:GNAT superfamily N-acetyltransferase
MEIVIRKAEARDVPDMLALVRELATFEKEPEAVTVTEAEMRDAGFGEKPVWWGWVAEEPAGSQRPIIVGMAVCYERYSTWRGRCLYLEDIIVTEHARGQRVGEKLFKACASFALEQGHHHMLWQVLDWNTEAMRFYVRLGATFEPKWVNGRMTRSDMQKLVSA